MFTGIITEIGKLKNVVRKGSSHALQIACKNTGEGLKLGDSVAINGACLSIVDASKGALSFDVVENTWQKTNLKRLTSGDSVNMENALRMGEALSGHMVSGHIDGERKIKNIQKNAKECFLDVEMLPGDEKHIVPKGSVALDGVSLTVGEVFRGFFRAFLIPHTLENTTLNLRKKGDPINVEFDMMGKYADKKRREGEITLGTLREKGFI